MAEAQGSTFTTRRAARALLVTALVFAGCAGRAERDGPGARAGSAGMDAPLAGREGANGGSASDGAAGGGAGALSFAGVAGMEAGRGANGGSSAGAGGEVSGRSGTGGAAGTSETGGGAGALARPEPDGIDCYGGNRRCAPGQHCVACDSDWRCVPDPERDPDGYANATAECGGTFLIGECDGPEDCPEGEYCVSPNLSPTLRCMPEPAAPPLECCLSCFGLRGGCTLCWTDADCPAGESCSVKGVWPNGVGGCR